MIPIDTPPGTKVICINTRLRLATRAAIVCGQIYTVHGWTTEILTNKPLVDLVENYDEEWAWEPENFRLLDIAGLDALLDAREKGAA
jgi:hypothetical protein